MASATGSGLAPGVRAVAFCPHPPVLVPELAQGAAGELDELRAACAAAVRAAADGADRLVLVGSGARSAVHPAGSRGSFAGYGVELDVGLGREAGARTLPLSLAVGAWLVADALGGLDAADVVGYEIGPDAVWPGDPSEIDAAGTGRTGLVVLGDGTARRSTKAPGYLDERAEPFDARLAEALRSGLPSRLTSASLDPDGIADALLAPAPRVWNAVAPLLTGASWQPELTYAEAPYGVMYFVATWTAGG